MSTVLVSGRDVSSLGPMRVPEVAERLGVSHSHVYALAADGVLPVVRGLGRAVRIDRALFEAWLEEQRRG